MIETKPTSVKHMMCMDFVVRYRENRTGNCLNLVKKKIQFYFLCSKAQWSIS